MNYDQYVHHFLVNLQPGTFEYTIYGDSGSSSQKIQAKLPKKSNHGLQKFLFFGDLDNTSLSQYTWDYLKSIWNNVDYETVIFLGDYGYEFWQQNGNQGDLFLDTLQPYSSTRPWMFTAGNHENNYNFTFYNEKFRLPNYPYANNHYYSFDVGMVHFISLNFLFYDDGQIVQDEYAKQKMLKWFEQDLIKANKNRGQVPWIVCTGHLALYCQGAECETYNGLYSKFDDLVYKYGVDVFLAGHRHQYQCVKPMYKAKIQAYELLNDKTIKNPKGPITLIQGNGGNRNMEQKDSVNMVSDEWLFFKEKGYTGIGNMIVYDEHHIKFEYVRTDNSKVSYEFDLIKDSHGPY